MFVLGFICGVLFVFLAAFFAVAMDKKKEDNSENRKNGITNLKTCPFCGNKNVEICSGAEIEEDENIAECYAVVCSIHDGGCGATGGYKNTREDAAKNWNNRTESN